LYAISPEGVINWKFDIGGTLRAAPVVDIDGVIFAGSSDHNLYAINPDGSFLWKFDSGGPIYTAPAINKQGTIFLGCPDKNLCSIDPDGKLMWKFQTYGAVNAPIVKYNGAESLVYFTSKDEHLYALNENRNVILNIAWRQSIVPVRLMFRVMVFWSEAAIIIFFCTPMTRSWHKYLRMT